MEIERKYLIDEKNLPADLESCRSVLIEQGYLCRKPVVRIRRQDDDYILTYKSGGLMAREEYNLPLGAEGYAHLIEKIDGTYAHIFECRKDITDNPYNFGGYPHGFFCSSYNTGYGSTALRGEKYSVSGI